LAEIPDHPKALTSLGLALYELQEFEEALQCYLRAAEVTPNDPVPLEKAALIHERLGNIKEASTMSLRAAELFLRSKEVDRAIENFERVIRLNPHSIHARSRLALVKEKIGQKDEAVAEYLNIAAILQHSGQLENARKTVEQALQVEPGHAEALRAWQMLKENRPLPLPERPRGGTGPLRMARVRQMEATTEEPVQVEHKMDPIAEARQRALTILAGMLFERKLERGEIPSPGLGDLAKGGRREKEKEIERAKIFLHLGEAIDAQTQGDDVQAAAELEHVIESGLDHPAAYFDYGYLLVKKKRLESAHRNLRHAVGHPEFALGARLLLGQVYVQMERWREGAVEYLEALKLADAQIVSPEQADELRQLYDSLIEEQSLAEDEQVHRQLCENISSFLERPDWQEELAQARQQLPSGDGGMQAIPVAKILTEARSSQVISQLARARELAEQGHLRTAMEEAYFAIQTAPTYLPLHSYIGELLLQQDRVEEAVRKFTVVARTYQVRGETERARDMYRRIVQLSPLDLEARQQLIGILIERDQVDEAISEYVDLAEAYYRLGQLEVARSTYIRALDLANQSRADRSWSTRILHHMADIDTQRLSWRRALRVYEQIRTIKPTDELARTKLIELNFRLGHNAQALAELDNFMSYLHGSGRLDHALEFLEKVVADYPENPDLRRRLIAFYNKVGRKADAISQLDALSDMLLRLGDKAGAIKALQALLKLDPPNAEAYRARLEELQRG
jgi:tetratricopeptide (TPR) repeat protein